MRHVKGELPRQNYTVRLEDQLLGRRAETLQPYITPACLLHLAWGEGNAPFWSVASEKYGCKMNAKSGNSKLGFYVNTFYVDIEDISVNWASSL